MAQGGCRKIRGCLRRWATCRGQRARFSDNPGSSPEGDSALQKGSKSKNRAIERTFSLAMLAPERSGGGARRRPSPRARARAADEVSADRRHNDLPAVIRESGKPPRDIAAYDLNRRTAGERTSRSARRRRGRPILVGVDTEPARSRQARVCADPARADRHCAAGDRALSRRPRLALTAAEIEQANAAGRIASLLGIEGGHAIENCWAHCATSTASACDT